jgi:hypothetical protein
LTTINVANTSTLYWTMTGNIANTDVRNGNTGSFTVLNSNATFSVSLANNILSGNDTKAFTLQLRKSSVSGSIVATAANTITVVSGATRSNFIAATGGTVIDTGTYRLHVFTSSSNSFTVTDAGRMGGYVDYLVVAGGGGGGGRNMGSGNSGSGGGAVGLLTGTNIVTAQTYPAIVGGAGSAGTDGIDGGKGGNTAVLGFTSVGGGGGSHGYGNPPGNPGGSGGGAAAGGAPAGTGIPGQGNPGGAGGSPETSAGGGGAGAAGGYPGGVGRPITWVPASYGTTGPESGRYFAGGGGGGSIQPSVGGRPGGAGGGGKGQNSNTGDIAFSGNVNTGGGGGGGGSGVPIYSGGAGGSGIIIIRYPYV